MSAPEGRILMVEDDPVDRMAFDRFVRRHGFPYSHVWAVSVTEARSRLAAALDAMADDARPSDRRALTAAVIDYRLGDGTALDLLADADHLPVVIVTGMGDEEIAVQAMKAGAHDYLIKDPGGSYLKTLATVLRNAIRHRANEVELRRYRLFLEQVVEERTAALVREIAERKAAEEALAEEKELLRVTLEGIGDGVISTDNAGSVVLINRAAEALTGWQRQDAAGRPLEAVFNIVSVSESTDHTLENPARTVLRDGRAVFLAEDVALIPQDGRRRLVSSAATPIRQRSGKLLGVVLVFRDVTEKRRMEAEMMKAQKLETLGILAGGIAHDFNNILTGIIGNISLARRRAVAGADIQAELEGVEKASLRATGLTRQLLTFAKGGAPVKRAFALAELILESTTFSLRGSNARSEFALAEGLWPVEGDAEQISQVIHNLVINADQAMPEGGRLRVEAENIRLAGGDHPRLIGGHYARVRFTDTGAGIRPENLPRIFDPYYTTKDRGTGLGLATTQSIIGQHGGCVEVDSEPGRGTTFTLYLPASDHAVDKGPEVAPPPPAQGERILVMDDDDTVRQVLRAMLESIGYQVELARDGEEAFRKYAAALSADPFDAVILDLTVPGGLGGGKALRKLAAIDPAVRAVVSSGYSNDPVVADPRGHGFMGGIAKPFKIEELSRVLYCVINESCS